MYNIMTCSGWENSIWGGCSIAWFVAAILVYGLLILRRQMENLEIQYDIIGGGIGTFIPFLILISITGSPKWAMLAGAIGMLIGFITPKFFDMGGGY